MARHYVETSILSFHYEVREQPAMVARREWTRRWWDEASARRELVSSPAVLRELDDGEFPGKPDALKLLAKLPLLEITPEVVATTASYIRHKVMPQDPLGDALHLALASCHRCDFLVTWNCRHLANANKFGHIRQINQDLGLMVPVLLTPYELLGEELI